MSDSRQELSDAGGIGELIRSVFDIGDSRPPPQGLRERKKRELRQRVSDTATQMFLRDGFDQVRVSDVAEACGVSDKTVFNYFPTKESMLLDREEEMAEAIERAIRDSGEGVATTDAIVAVIECHVEMMFSVWEAWDSPAEALLIFRDFADMIDQTPSLLAAMNAMMERLTQVAAGALAERAGVDPEDPEPQLAAAIALGLWQSHARAVYRYSDGSREIAEVKAAVLDDIRRTARVANTGLSTFDLALRLTTSDDELAAAMEAGIDARRQMVRAIKQARQAWIQVMDEVRAAGDAADPKGNDRRARRQAMRAKQREIQTRKRKLQAQMRRGQGRGHHR
ncbi:MAG: TetR family transcriptional regulator [Acidimicrobiia bacterium]